MMKMYSLATDPDMPLDERYAIVQAMQTLRRINPSNHIKRARKAAKQRLYNEQRLDYRVYIKQ